MDESGILVNLIKYAALCVRVHSFNVFLLLVLLLLAADSLLSCVLSTVSVTTLQIHPGHNIVVFHRTCEYTRVPLVCFVLFFSSSFLILIFVLTLTTQQARVNVNVVHLCTYLVCTQYTYTDALQHTKLHSFQLIKTYNI